MPKGVEHMECGRLHVPASTLNFHLQRLPCSEHDGRRLDPSPYLLPGRGVGSAPAFSPPGGV